VHALITAETAGIAGERADRGELTEPIPHHRYGLLNSPELQSIRVEFSALPVLRCLFCAACSALPVLRCLSSALPEFCAA
jgi:hypothetical protein